MKVFKPPEKPTVRNGSRPSVFLAGSIEMGSAEDWQKVVEEELASYHVVIYNPRRDDWDPNWEQSIDNPKFKEQVDWELDQLTRAGIKFFYFSPNTKSPITLAELGYTLGQNFEYGVHKKHIVCCPEGFWRKGNVEIMCRRHGIRVQDSLEEAILELKSLLKQTGDKK